MAVTLNLYIFQLLSYRITYSSTFNRLLEFSLISKSVNRIIQKIIISEYFNKNIFILTLPQFIKYVNNNGNDDDEKYKLKLIQYRDIQIIRFNINGMVINKQVKDKLKNCIKLTKVVIMDTIKCDFNITHDYTFNGFFKIKSLLLYWTYKILPLSNGEFITTVPQIRYYGDFKFTFSFLKYYNPSQIIIETSENRGYQYYDYHGGSDTSLHCKHLENILNFKSIKSIIFKNHYTSKEFIKSVLSSSSSNIKSLQLSIMRPSIESFVLEIIDDLKFAGLHENNTLKSLVITIYSNPDWDSNYVGYDENINQLFTFIGTTCSTTNTSLKKFGLTGILIDKYDYDVLNPLINSNISTIVTNSDSLLVFLEHIKENSNIKKLHCINVPNCNSIKDLIKSTEYLECNGLLQSYHYYYYRDNDPNVDEDDEEDDYSIKQIPPLIKLSTNKNLLIKLNY